MYCHCNTTVTLQEMGRLATWMSIVHVSLHHWHQTGRVRIHHCEERMRTLSDTWILSNVGQKSWEFLLIFINCQKHCRHLPRITLITRRSWRPHSAKPLIINTRSHFATHFCYILRHWSSYHCSATVPIFFSCAFSFIHALLDVLNVLKT
jgi:hypothetical protein